MVVESKTESNRLWFKTISAIHHNPNMFNLILIWASIMSTWKNIISINEDLQALSIDLCRRICAITGRVDKICFWSDYWIDHETLGDKFPAIAKLSLSKQCKVEECYTITNGVITWNINLKRA